LSGGPAQKGEIRGRRRLKKAKNRKKKIKKQKKSSPSPMDKMISNSRLHWFL